MAVATYPFAATQPADLPLEIGDDLYIIEQGGKDGSWLRGYLVAPPSLLAGLTSGKGQTLEARVFSGIFPRCCVEIREHLGDNLIDGQTHGILANGDSPKFDHTKSDSPRRQSSLAHRTSSLRRENSSGSFRRKGNDMNGDATKDSTWPTRATSQRTPEGQRLARSLSRQSITSSRSKKSPRPITPSVDVPRDRNAKRPQAPVPMLKIGDETPTSSTEPLVDEIASCLREWHSKNIHELLLARRYSVLDKISHLVKQLDVSRQQLLHGVLTSQELDTVREETVWNLVNGNKLLSNEVVVRDPKQRGRLLTSEDSPIDILRLQSTMSLLERPPVIQHDSVNLHHLMVELKGFGASGLLSPTLNLYLCARSPGQPPKTLTESFAIDLPSPEALEKSAALGKLRTLFIDLTSNDIGDSSRPGVELFLVVKIQASFALQTVAASGSRKTNRSEEPGSMERSIGGSVHTSSTVKGGRQSMMWAQKQFDSIRNRNPHVAAQNTSPSASLSQLSGEKSRPTTQEGPRPTTQQGTQYVKRVTGVGIIGVRDVFRQIGPCDPQISIWAPALTFLDTQGSTDGHWDELLREFMTSQNGIYAKAKTVEHAQLSLQSFTHPSANDLVYQNAPNVLQNIITTRRTDFPGAPKTPRSDIYIKICEASLPSQALLSHPERGTIMLPSGFELKNMTLTLEVRKRSGQRIENCIVPSSNSPGQTAWRTQAAEKGERWDQSIRLAIPVDDVPEAHLIMSIANYPDFPWALCWMPLWTEDAFIKDGVHAPLLYVYDKVTSSWEDGKGAYLGYPWSSRGKDGDEREEALTGPVATLRLETKLCSTHYSQDKTLLGLIKWRQLTKSKQNEHLRHFKFVPEIEIVKLAGQVLDSLFDILVLNNGSDEDEDLVFSAIVKVLGIVHDRRFNLGPFVDEYAERTFDQPYAAPYLIRCYLRLLAHPADTQARAAFKVGRQLLKFIFCAREKQKLKEAGIGATTQSAFKRDLRSIFSAFEALVKDPSPALIGSKTLVVQHIPTWLPELRVTFSEEEVLQIATNFVEACSDVQGKLILYKLALIINLTEPSLFSQDNARHSIISNTYKWIDPYWGSHDDAPPQWREQIRLCSSIVSKQIGQSGFVPSQYVIKVVQSYTGLMLTKETSKTNMTFPFPTTYPFPSKPSSTEEHYDEALVELAALLALLGNSLTIPANLEGSDMAQYITATLNVITSVLSGHAFPKPWLSAYVAYHKSSLEILGSVFAAMNPALIPTPEDADKFDTELWGTYLRTLLTLVSSDVLALETFPEQKRRAIWRIAGDVRQQGATLLQRSWEAIGWETDSEEQKRYGLSRLGGFQVQYVPGLVAPILDLCLSVHEGLRGVAVKILQAMIISEWTLNEDLSVIQAEMIDCLDLWFKSKNTGESIVQKMFVSELVYTFEPLARMPLDPLWQAIAELVEVIDELLELLAAVHSPDISESLRIMNTLQLMTFLKDMKKEDIFIQYVHQLAVVQDKLHNKTEAGLALQLHADQYTWEPTPVRQLTDPVYPEQSSFERKERLYFEMIHRFEEGAAWGCALATYEELAEQYKSFHFDFAKHARTQRAMATIYDTIAKGEWQVPRYFKVIYYGLGFPTNLREREFVYEGGPSERYAAFTDRMRQLHPSAQIIAKGEPDSLEGQYLLISSVSVYRNLEHPVYQQPKVAQSTREYITASKPDRFAVTSKRHSPGSGVENQWIEKTIYTTNDKFPTILRRSEIIKAEVVRLSPLQTALERTNRKTAELATHERRVINGDETGFSNLTEAIISSIDPNSAATVSQYRQLLPRRPEDSDSDASEEEPLSPLHKALQIAILDHVSSLKHCLTHYGSPAHFGTQTSLLDSLQQTFAPELALLAPNLPPTVEPTFTTSSPAHSLAGVPSATTPILTNGDSTIHSPPPESMADSQQRPRSRLSFNMLKTSLQSPTKPNGNISAHSDDGSTSNHVLQTTPQNSVTAATTAHTRSEGTLTPGSDRPSTAKSGSSGKVKKRLSLLGLGRVGSGRENKKIEGMGGLTEE